MPVLDNAKHELFAQGLAKGETAIAAYEAAGYQPDRGAASRLSANVNIAARVVELQSAVAEQTECTIADIAKQLDEDRTLAHSVEQAGAAVSATMGKAKLFGLIKEKHEHFGKDGGPIETKELSDSETARRLAFILTRGAKAAEKEA